MMMMMMMTTTRGSYLKWLKQVYTISNVIICIFQRAMHLTYESTENVKKIEVYRFTAPDEVYLSGDVYPPNKGFCVPPGCLPTGLLNISLCQPMSKSS